jgi:glycosyltransferase involved in cell wall biosynthesis
MTPKVSIIIPVYKVEQYLNKSIQSCLNQTLREIEIVLVNDGSPDGSKEIIEHYANIDDRVKFIHKKNQGVTLARKDGLSMAVGDYIFYLDGDDYLTDNAIELLYNKAIKEKADWVVGDFYLDFGNKILEKKFKDLGVVNNIDFLKYCFENRDFFFTGRLIRTVLIKRLNLDIPPNITYGEDNLAVVQSKL